MVSRGQRDRQQRRAGSRSAVASSLLPKVLAMNLFLLPLNGMATRILARNSVTCCRRLSHVWIGDVLRNIFLKECRVNDRWGTMINFCFLSSARIDFQRQAKKQNKKKTSTVSIEGSAETASRPPFKAAVVVAGSCFIFTPT